MKARFNSIVGRVNILNAGRPLNFGKESEIFSHRENRVPAITNNNNNNNGMQEQYQSVSHNRNYEANEEEVERIE